MNILRRLFFLVILVLLLTGCQAQPETNTLIVGFIPDAAPFTYLNEEGFCTGFEIELIEQAAAKMGLEPQYTQVAWVDLQTKISEGKIDLFVGYLTDKDLPEDVLLSESYLDNSQVFMVRTNEIYESPLDLAGKTVTIFEDSLSHQLIQWEYQKEVTDTWIIQYSVNMETALEDLLSGQSDAWLAPLYSVEDFIEQYPEELSRIRSAFYEEKLATAFSAGRETLVEQYNAALRILQAEGKLSEIALGWFGFDPITKLTITP
jgi:polar amino acid transport system substrate-binding protein